MLRFFKQTLRIRIIGWSFVPTAIILLAVALVTFYAYRQVTEDLVTGRNRELTRLAASQLAAGLREHTDLLAALARTSGILDDDAAVRRAALSQARNRAAVFDGGVIVLNRDGVVAAAEPERPDIVGQDWSNRAYFRQLLGSGGPVFSDIVADGVGGSDVIVVAVPIIGEQGELRGSIAGMFRLGATSVSAFYGGIVKLRLEGSDSTYLVDSTGRVIYHSDAKRIGSNISGQPVVREVLTRRVGDLRTYDIAGRGTLASFAPVPGTPWGLVTEADWASLMSSSQAYQQFLLLLLALGVIVPALVVTFAVRRITDPIAAVIRAAKEVASGRFGHTIKVSTGDELEELARQFNRMSLQLKESYAHLEKTLEDRTRELATLNAIAAVASSSLELEQILEDALAKTMETMNVGAGSIYRFDPVSRSLTLLAHRGVRDEFESTGFSAAISNIIESAAESGQPFVRQVEDYPDGDLKEFLKSEGLQVIVGAPMTAKGRLLGVIYLGSRSPRTFAPEELSLLSAIGQQIGVAMEIARLYQQVGQSAVAAERSRLARDLHDAVSQTLFSASLIAEVLPRLWERNPDEGRRRLEELRQLTRGALAEMRMLLLELRPTALTEASLSDLLRQLAEATTGRARIPVEVVVEGSGALPVDVRVALYRIAQEALNNVAKHSEATRAAVRLSCDGDRVELSVVDDGRGFEVRRTASDHLGLAIMRERAEAIGAELAIASGLGQGTQVAVVWQKGAQPSSD